MGRSDAPPVALLLFCAGCADLIGANFDVEPLPSTGGAGAGGDGAGGAVEIETIWEGDYPWDVVVSGAFVTWSSSGGPGPGGILRWPKSGGAVQVYTPSYRGANRIVDDGTELFFTGSGPDPADFVVGRCNNVTLSCETLAQPSGSPIGITLDAKNVYFTEAPSTLQVVTKESGDPVATYSVPVDTSQILLHGQHLWGTSIAGDQVWWVMLPLPPSGEALPLVSAAMPAANGLCPYDSNVVVAGGFTLDAKVSHFGNFSSATDLAINQAQVADLTSDSLHIYWATFGDGRVSRVAKVGGTPKVLVSGEDSANGVAVDESYLYFTRFAPQAAGGAVRRVSLVP